jgi:hypothetical protein
MVDIRRREFITLLGGARRCLAVDARAQGPSSWDVAGAVKRGSVAGDPCYEIVSTPPESPAALRR